MKMMLKQQTWKYAISSISYLTLSPALFSPRDSWSRNCPWWCSLPVIPRGSPFLQLIFPLSRFGQYFFTVCTLLVPLTYVSLVFLLPYFLLASSLFPSVAFPFAGVASCSVVSTQIHLYITLSVPADKQLPAVEQMGDHDEGRSSTAMDFEYGSRGGHHKMQENKQLHWQKPRGTVCSFHVWRHICTQSLSLSLPNKIHTPRKKQYISSNLYKTLQPNIHLLYERTSSGILAVWNSLRWAVF